MKNYLLFIAIFLTSCSLFSATITLNMNYENTARSFMVHFPPGFSNSQHLPLVFNLHGLGSNAGQQELYSRMSETADSNNFVVCYPNGIGNSWNSGFQPPYNSSPDDVGFISKILDTLSTLYNINLNRVYACGMSNGGFQSYRLACDLENRIAAIASVTGNITELTALNCVLSRKVPVLHIHGTNDPLVDYAGSTGYKSVEETINFWLTNNQCSSTNDTVQYPDIDVNDSSTVERIHYASCVDRTEVMFFKITGGGHTWPNAYINFIYGPTNRDFDASQEIWDFFNRFTLSGPSAIEKPDIEIEMNVFPNPVENGCRLQVAGYKGQDLQAGIFDIAGRKMFEQRIISSSTQINLTNLSPGIYMLKVEGKEYAGSRRIIKE